jgi:phosphonate transport system substrate-binding protein
MEITKKIFAVQGDDKLSAEEKTAKLKELEAEKAKYDALLVKVPQA